MNTKLTCEVWGKESNPMDTALKVKSSRLQELYDGVDFLCRQIFVARHPWVRTMEFRVPDLVPNPVITSPLRNICEFGPYLCPLPLEGVAVYAAFTGKEFRSVRSA